MERLLINYLEISNTHRKREARESKIVIPAVSVEINSIRERGQGSVRI